MIVTGSQVRGLGVGGQSAALAIAIASPARFGGRIVRRHRRRELTLSLQPMIGVMDQVQGSLRSARFRRRDGRSPRCVGGFFFMEKIRGTGNGVPPS